MLVEAVLPGLPRAEVQGEAHQRGEALVGSGVVGGEHPRVAHHVQHDLRAARGAGLEGVEGVEHVAGVDLEPADVGPVAVAGHQPDPRDVLGVPRVGQRRRRVGDGLAAGHGVHDPLGHRVAPERGALLPGREPRQAGHAVGHHAHVEGDRQVVDHHVVLREGAVVDHRHPAGLDLQVLHDGAVDADDGVVDRGAPHPVVRDRVQVAGHGVGVRMSGVALRPAEVERAAEVAPTDGVELEGQLVGRGPGLDDRQRLAGVLHHVGVRSVVLPRRA